MTIGVQHNETLDHQRKGRNGQGNGCNVENSQWVGRGAGTDVESGFGCNVESGGDKRAGIGPISSLVGAIGSQAWSGRRR